MKETTTNISNMFPQRLVLCTILLCICSVSRAKIFPPPLGPAFNSNTSILFLNEKFEEVVHSIQSCYTVISAVMVQVKNVSELNSYLHNLNQRFSKNDFTKPLNLSFSLATSRYERNRTMLVRRILHDLESSSADLSVPSSNLFRLHSIDLNMNLLLCVTADALEDEFIDISEMTKIIKSIRHQIKTKYNAKLSLTLDFWGKAYEAHCPEVQQLAVRPLLQTADIITINYVLENKYILAFSDFSSLVHGAILSVTPNIATVNPEATVIFKLTARWTFSFVLKEKIRQDDKMFFRYHVIIARFTHWLGRNIGMQTMFERIIYVSETMPEFVKLVNSQAESRRATLTTIHDTNVWKISDIAEKTNKLNALSENFDRLILPVTRFQADKLIEFMNLIDLENKRNSRNISLMIAIPVDSSLKTEEICNISSEIISVASANPGVLDALLLRIPCYSYWKKSFDGGVKGLARVLKEFWDIRDRILPTFRESLNSFGIRLGLAECQDFQTHASHTVELTYNLGTRILEQVDVVVLTADVKVEFFQLQDIDDMKTRLLSLKKKLKYEFASVNKKDVVILGRSPFPKDDCYGYHEYWEVLLNWAEITGYKVAPMNAFYSGGEDNRDGGWFKPKGGIISIGSFPGIKYTSKLYEPCIVLDTSAPTKTLPFQGSMHAGVSFNMSNSGFSGISLETAALLLEMIRFKFSRVELICDNLRSCASLLEDLSSTKLSKYTTDELRIFFNIDNILSQTRDSRCYDLINELTQNTIMSIVEGIHGKCITPNLNKLDKKKISGKKLGTILTYQGEFQPDDLLVENVQSEKVEYLVLDVNPITAVATNLYTEPITADMEETEYSHMYGEQNIPKIGIIYDLFDRIIYYRTRIREASSMSNFSVIIRLKWPRRIYDDTVDKPEDAQLIAAVQAEKWLKFWNYVHQFSSVYDLPFFIHEAFDVKEETAVKYGWWNIADYADLYNISVITDAEADHLNLETKRPVPPKRQARDKENIHKSFYIVISVVVVLMTTVLTSILLSLSFVLRRRNQLLSSDEVRAILAGVTEGDQFLGGQYQRERYELRKSDFHKPTSTIIGMGNYGIVYKTMMSKFGGLVAVKTVASKKDPEEKKFCVIGLLVETKVLSLVGEHTNVLKLLGAYTAEIGRGNLFLVTEYCEGGSLLAYLRRHNNQNSGCKISTYQLLKFCQDICSGMAHLAEKRIVHGDVSTRNVLLDGSNTCKLSDFGLSRKLEHCEKYVKKGNEPLPWRWMSLESLQKLEFTFKSDIWSVGVAIWEIFSMGAIPYRGVKESRELVEILLDGKRLEKPGLASEKLFDLMLSCWLVDACGRPTAERMKSYFQDMRRQEYDII